MYCTCITQSQLLFQSLPILFNFKTTFKMLKFVTCVVHMSTYKYCACTTNAIVTHAFSKHFFETKSLKYYLNKYIHLYRSEIKYVGYIAS